ncbi:MAG: peptide chain release factor 2 [bacterium]
MLDGLASTIEELREKVKTFGGVFDLDAKRARLAELDKAIARPDLWDDPERAQRLTRERAHVSDLVSSWDELAREVDETAELVALAAEEPEEDRELVAQLEAAVKRLQKAVADKEFQLTLSGEHDGRDAIVMIHSGAGGTESQDWAEMLLRMYLRWAERRGFAVSFVEASGGEEAGLKSATIEVAGPYAFGNLRSEVGVHRLVRISPFDAASRRHTSFASVFVFPDIDEEIEVEIDESDLRIDTYRSSGAGGQHVNVTDSAVRITHKPTGLVVSCQNERSQHKNKATAMKILRARLYELEQVRQKEKMEELHKDKKEIAWGSQIRSYVFHPYRMVKDHRTAHETGNIDAVMDGDLDPFIEAYLLKG